MEITIHSPVARKAIVEWVPVTAREKQAWANRTDAVEAGAYRMAIAAVEMTYGWFALARAETLTGADYYVGPAGADLESAYRLEVSGVDMGDAERTAFAPRAVFRARPCVRRGIQNAIYTRFDSRAEMIDQEHQRAQELASLLASPDLPSDARAQLEELAEAARFDRMPATLQASRH
jgi:hypothetical protein